MDDQTQTQPQPQKQDQDTDDVVRDLKTSDTKAQTKKLCDLAFKKGVGFAVKVARELDNPYALDELHDALTEELNKKLIEEGKLEQL